jgi:uncharacterized phage protein (TIGR01671 family)
MREIKFRIWDKERKNWGWTYSLALHCSGQLYSHPGCHNQTPHYEIMLSTGLKDKNGKEIYEGDIIKWSEDHLTDGGENIKTIKDIGEVIWSPEFAMFGLRGRELGHWQFYEHQEYEVLGNIYENPELRIKQKTAEDRVNDIESLKNEK